MRIFARVGIPEVVVVASDTGIMGGSIAHEFMLICDAGEDTIASCSICDEHANAEVATANVVGKREKLLKLTEIETPACSNLEQLLEHLQVPANKILMKSPHSFCLR